MFFIYNPLYNRTVRILDFYLSINLSLFFTFLPYYFSENSQLKELMSKRSIENRNKSLNQFNLKIEEVKHYYKNFRLFEEFYILL